MDSLSNFGQITSVNTVENLAVEPIQFTRHMILNSVLDCKISNSLMFLKSVFFAGNYRKYFPKYKKMSDDDLEAHPLTHEEICKIAKNFWLHLPNLSHAELLRLVETNEDERMKATMANMIDLHVHANDLIELNGDTIRGGCDEENVSFWYTIKPRTLLCVDQYIRKMIKENGRQRECTDTIIQINDEGSSKENDSGAENLRETKEKKKSSRKRRGTPASETQGLIFHLFEKHL